MDVTEKAPCRQNLHVLTKTGQSPPSYSSPLCGEIVLSPSFVEFFQLLPFQEDTPMAFLYYAIPLSKFFTNAVGASDSTSHP